MLSDPGAGIALLDLGIVWGRRRVKGTSVSFERGCDLLPADGGKEDLGAASSLGWLFEQVILWWGQELVTDTLSDGNQAGQRPFLLSRRLTLGFASGGFPTLPAASPSQRLGGTSLKGEPQGRRLGPFLPRWGLSS